jgi:hypothetical protein
MKTSLQEYCAGYYQENKNRLREYYQENKEQRKQKALEYYYKNKDRVRQRNKKRLLENPVYKIECTLRWSFNSALKARGIYKTKSFKELVGCDLNTFKDYIEKQWLPGMSWMNHSYKGWHLDHIKPIKTFDLTNMEEQKKCFHYTNFRPLWWKDNLSRPKDGRDLIKFPGPSREPPPG